MSTHVSRSIILGTLLAAGCVEPASTGTAAQELGACGLFDYPLPPQRQLTPADIPSLTALEKAQIVEAVKESSHTDVTTVEEAFDRVDQHEINLLIARDTSTNQFFIRVEYGAGENSYGAIFYWDTAVKAAAIHDGFEEECGPLTYTYGQGDIAEECGGLLTYINTATYAALDAYLPSNVASGIVAQRPFSSIAGILTVYQLGDTRLQQIYNAAVTGGFVGASCNGIHDQHAISVGQTAKLLELANEASFEELHDGVFAGLINRYQVASNLIGGRTFTAAAQVAATPHVGTVGFHRLRNAAVFRNPFEQVVAEANAVAASEDWYARFDQHFDWRALIAEAGGNDHVVSMHCYGIPPALVPQIATYSANPTIGEDLLETAQQALGMPSVGHLDEGLVSAAFYDLAYRTEFESFIGCRWVVEPDPWSWHHVRLFVDTSNGAGYLFEIHYEE